MTPEEERERLIAKLRAEAREQRSLPPEMRTSGLSLESTGVRSSCEYFTFGDTSVRCVTTQRDGRESKIYGEGCLLVHDSSGWMATYDHGAIMKISLAQGAAHMTAEEYNALRVSMIELEAARDKHRPIALFDGSGSVSLERLKSLSEASERLDSKPDAENERIIVSVIRCARKQGRVPFKGEAREEHNTTRPEGNAYTESTWQRRLKRIGLDWLPTGTRKESRS
jgi:hypothetical protein